jgi:hypothetical protein
MTAAFRVRERALELGDFPELALARQGDFAETPVIRKKAGILLRVDVALFVVLIHEKAPSALLVWRNTKTPQHPR